MATNIDLSTALPEAMASGMSYAEYSAENKVFAKEGKTSGPQKEAYVEYTKLGAARLKRWEKVYKPTAQTLEGIAALVQPGEQWLVFSETWCGDAAHNLPFIAKWAEFAGVDLRVIYRDEHPDLMDEFLTNGGRSIPKLVRMDSDFQVKGTWGPRPAPLMVEYAKWRAQEEFDYKAWTLFAQDWYNKDKGASLEQDFREMLVG